MRFAEYERIADNLKAKNKQMEEEIRLLEKGVLKTRNDKEQLWLKVREKEEELDALASILNRARSCIKEALQVSQISKHDSSLKLLIFHAFKFFCFFFTTIAHCPFNCTS